jgi:hypothetical protein
MTHRSEIILVAMTSARSTPHIPRFRALLLGLAFFAFAVLAACDRQSTPRPGSDVTELSRVTSPNGLLDAVLTQDLYGGAVGGVDSEVYIVRKGAPVKLGTAYTILQADPFTNAKLVWKQDHLLQIYYDVAHIRGFRNLWGLHEIENVGSTGERDFEVEIRLEPLGDFSMLAPDGSFRHSY